MEPVFCILSAIDHIILPHQYTQMKEVWQRLSQVEVEHRDVMEDLLPSFSLPFPMLQLLSNYSRPLQPYKRKGGQQDWVVHAHFRDFDDGIAEIPACPHFGICHPGTVTAVMARYARHSFPPVNGERFILTQVFCNPLVQYVGLSDLPARDAPSVNNCNMAATTEDASLSLFEADHLIYEWKWEKVTEHQCACCWQVPTLTHVQYDNIPV